MKKLLVCVPVMALMIAVSASASANEGAISDATLSAMGLSGMQVMSDEAAMEVRGQGFNLTFGGSYAYVGGRGASAGSVDGFLSFGKYHSHGAHGSVAGKTVTHTKVKRIKGRPAYKVKKTHSVKVYAGGFATSSSF